MCYSVLKLCKVLAMFIIGLLGRAWVSLTLMYIANGTVPMHEEPQQKTRLQHTTTVWYIGSCTNKHDKLMNTSIQVLNNAKICSFVYWYSIFGMVNYVMENEQQRLLTLYSFGMCSGHYQQHRRRQIKNYTFGYKDTMQDTWLRRYNHGHRLSCSLNIIYCTLHTYSSCCTVHSTVQPQAHPTMLLACV